MKKYVSNLEKDALDNDNFRQVVFTASNCQLVLMNLRPGEEIGTETHALDQFFRFEKGQGKVVLDGEEKEVEDGFAVIVPAGVEHNIINVSKDHDLKLYTIYAPPEHRDGTTHATKEEAEADHDHHFDGQIST